MTGFFGDPGIVIARAFDGSSTPKIKAAETARANEATASARMRVLVVDDEPLIADTVAQILNQHDYDAFRAYSGAEALALVERFRPDFLLADVMMPGMNGIDLAVSVEKLLPAVKVLLFSGQAGAVSLLQKVESVGEEFRLVAKPIHPEKLVQILREMSVR